MDEGKRIALSIFLGVGLAIAVALASSSLMAKEEPKVEALADLKTQVPLPPPLQKEEVQTFQDRVGVVALPKILQFLPSLIIALAVGIGAYVYARYRAG